ncbi:MAG: hypothetical protein JWM69_865, partial [Candidatus Binatus sp.]|nr:hypothetical protein [Candidatus Binatus sp.]
RDLQMRRRIAPSKVFRVSILGTPASIYVCPKVG